MAGVKGRSGRKPKPTAHHRKVGNYRKSRHSDRADDSLKPIGEPEQLVKLTRHAKKMFEHLRESMPPGVAGAVDSAALTLLAESWARYRQAVEIYAKTKDRNDLYAISRCVGDFVKLSSRFGLSPADRSALSKQVINQEPANPMSAMLSKYFENN